MSDTPVEEQIGGWNVSKKQYTEVEYVPVKKQSDLLSVTIMSGRCAVIGGIFCHRSLLAILRRKIGKPKEEIGNLNGFEYMYLSDFKVPYF